VPCDVSYIAPLRKYAVADVVYWVTSLFLKLFGLEAEGLIPASAIFYFY
jgi:hypothetical protein